MSQCPNCGTQASGKFCPNCGAQLPDQTAAAAMPPQPQPQQYVQQPQPPMPPQQPYPPQYQPQPGYQTPPKKKGIGFFGWLGIAMGAIALALVALVAIGGGAGGDIIITDHYSGETTVDHMTSIPSTSQDIWALINVKTDGPASFVAKWYVDNEHVDGLDLSHDVSGVYDGALTFHIYRKDGAAWPKGKYKVEVWKDGTKQAESAFNVK